MTIVSSQVGWALPSREASHMFPPPPILRPCSAYIPKRESQKKEQMKVEEEMLRFKRNDKFVKIQATPSFADISCLEQFAEVGGSW